MEEETKKKGSWLAELIKTVLLVLVIVVPFRAFVAQPFLVVGNSMLQTFEDKEYLIVDELSTRFRDIKRGDVVIVKFPALEKKYLIKRIVGLPGETISFENGRVFIFEDGEEGSVSKYELSEPYVYSNPAINGHTEDKMVTLKPGEFYALGDNRLESADSRMFGPITKQDIKGAPILRLWPFEKIAYKPGAAVPEMQAIAQ